MEKIILNEETKKIIKAIEDVYGKKLKDIPIREIERLGKIFAYLT